MIAPLSDDTLVIGTNDSGRTIHSEFDAPEDTVINPCVCKEAEFKTSRGRVAHGSMHFIVVLLLM